MILNSQDEIQLFTKSKLLSQLDYILNISYLQSNIPNCKISKIPLHIIKRFNNYKETISSFDEKVIICDYNQRFSYPVFWDNDFEVYTNFIFNISKLNELPLKDNLNETEEISVSELYDKIDCSSFEHQPPSRTFGSIYLSYFFPLNNKLLVLDGNHRIYEAYKKKQNTIEALILSEDCYYNLLENNSLKILYKIYRDYVLYLNAINNDIEIDSSFFIELLDNVIAYNEL